MFIFTPRFNRCGAKFRISTRNISKTGQCMGSRVSYLQVSSVDPEMRDKRETDKKYFTSKIRNLSKYTLQIWRERTKKSPKEPFEDDYYGPINIFIEGLKLIVGDTPQRKAFFSSLLIYLNFVWYIFWGRTQLWCSSTSVWL